VIRAFTHTMLDLLHIMHFAFESRPARIDENRKMR